MSVRIQRISPSRVLSAVFLSAAVLAASVIDARAACVAPSGPKLSPLTGVSRLARPGATSALAAAAQGAGATGNGAIVGQWQVVMTAFPGTPGEFIYDVAFQQFHTDGTELMNSAGVPPTIGNGCIGVLERGSQGASRLRHMTWNWNGDEVLGDAPTGYFLLDATLRPNSQGTAYSGTWKAASYDLGAGPLGSGGPPQAGSEAEGTLQAVRISVE